MAVRSDQHDGPRGGRIRLRCCDTRPQWRETRQYPDRGRIKSGLITNRFFFELGLRHAAPDRRTATRVDHVDDKRPLCVLRDAHVGLIHAVVAAVHGMAVVTAVAS